MATVKTKALPLRTWRDELPMLARPAAILLAVAIGAALFVGASGVYRADQQATLADATRARDLSAARIRDVATEKQDLILYRERYAQLQAAGLIGDENRLGWIEAVRRIQASRKLVSATYEIEPQQVLAAPAGAATGQLQLRGSRMHLNLGLVHEGDLFYFLDDLRMAGMYSVQDCRMKRNDVPADAVGLARLNAACTLIWLTLGAAPAKPAPATNKAVP